MCYVLITLSYFLLNNINQLTCSSVHKILDDSGPVMKLGHFSVELKYGKCTQGTKIEFTQATTETNRSNTILCFSWYSTNFRSTCVKIHSIIPIHIYDTRKIISVLMYWACQTNFRIALKSFAQNIICHAYFIHHGFGLNVNAFIKFISPNQKTNKKKQNIYPSNPFLLFINFASNVEV